MPWPAVIFFDAVGTLFGVRRTVGDIYGQFAAAAGVSVDTHRLNQAFIEGFRLAPRETFAGVTPQDLPRREYEWWRAIAHHCFGQVGVLEQLSDFDAFFQPMFAHFETAEPWVVYPEVPDVLQALQRLDIPLAVISNFDTRLYGVLKALELETYFCSVTLSTQVGAAKPEPKIFEAALAQHSVLPSEAWHVGDSWGDDYEGATAMGLKGIWLQREDANVYGITDSPGVEALPDLRSLPIIVQS